MARETEVVAKTSEPESSIYSNAFLKHWYRDTHTMMAMIDQYEKDMDIPKFETARSIARKNSL
jgi:hypothetical protein